MDKNRVVYSTKEIGDFTCPFFGISIKGLGEHNCATQSSVLGKNRAYCCISKCPSKWRRCPICLEQGVNNSCSVELKTGYCKFHKKHGPEAKNDGNSDRRAINGGGRVASQKELKEADNYIARYEKSKISDSAMSSKKEERGEKEKNNQKGGDIKKTFKELSHFDRIQVVRDAVSSNQGGNAAAAEELGISLALVGFYMQADNLDEKVKKMLKKDAPNPLGFAIAVKLSVLPAVIQIETATQIIENDFSNDKANKLIKAFKKGIGFKKGEALSEKKGKEDVLKNVKAKKKKRKYTQRLKVETVDSKKLEMTASSRPVGSFSEVMLMMVNGNSELIKKIVVETEKGIRITAEKI